MGVQPTDRDAWLAARRKGIGGSEVAAIVWPSLPANVVGDEHRPFSTALEVWLDKTGGEREDHYSEAMWAGNRLERTVAEMTQERAPVIETEEAPGLQVVWREVEVGKRKLNLPMVVNLDGIGIESGLDTDEHVKFIARYPDYEPVPGRPVGLEYKTSSAWLADMWAEDIPLIYYCQVQWYMAATGLPVFYVGALIGGNDFRPYLIEYDAIFAEHLMREAAVFWYDNVVADLPPALDGSKAALEVARKVAGPAGKGIVIELGDPEVVALCEQYTEATAEVKQAEERQREAQAKLIQMLGNAERAKAEDGWSFGYTNVTTSRFDAKAFKETHPKLHDEFVRATTSRRWAAPKRKEPK